MTTVDKTKEIETILKLTKKQGDTEMFDKLLEYEPRYLSKLLQVVKNLKKVK